MARKRSKDASVARFRSELQALDQAIPQDLRLPSLGQSPPRLQGYSFKFTLHLPFLSASGEEVFTSDHLSQLYSVIGRRLGGFSATSSTSHPPLYGYYQPTESTAPVKDFHTQVIVYAAPLDAANLFFARLKAILRTASLQPQEEILIERLDAMLI